MVVDTVEPHSNGFRRLTVLSCFTRKSVIANKGIKRNQLEGTMNYVSVIRGIPLVAGPLERGSNVRSSSLTKVLP